MYPVLLDLGPLDFHSYAVFMSIGFLTAVLLSIRENYRRARPYPVTPLGGLWVFLGGLFGARLYYILQYQPENQEWYHAFYVWSGGLVFYGGAIGGFIGGVIYVLLAGAPVVGVGDMAIKYVPLAHAIARVGCFLNGCCWGSCTTAVPWAVHFPKGSAPYRQHVEDQIIQSDAAFSFAVHPTQLYETFALLLIFVALWTLYRFVRLPGFHMLAYLFLYGCARLVTESFRGDSSRHALHMTVSQYVAIGMIGFATALAALLWLTVWRRYEQPAPTADNHVDTPEPPVEAAS